jgi:hypothetical protein
MDRDKHDMVMRPLRKQGSTITHILDGLGQARYGRETIMKEWIQRSLTSWMEWDKHDMVVREL